MTALVNNSKETGQLKRVSSEERSGREGNENAETGMEVIWTDKP